MLPITPTGQPRMGLEPIPSGYLPKIFCYIAVTIVSGRVEESWTPDHTLARYYFTAKLLPDNNGALSP